ncbi:hypothetical protein [Maribacter hydrothermalis]|uniref:Complex I intermediate-associated protein 30 (CIA30) n=1 Tax=Maribacter hydrothermalis TaxID=1836467 RepID=A0A1B7ZEW0_9FLAO|nr:hypothetical protein [Maribacter hydrothermalis]APQ17596.1 hypothetical protein BTR34_09755 [Maribacter hydrothermalis]OBR42071.1 hypothetical protein A9200_01385 [Maribacter hydrothermalis]
MKKLITLIVLTVSMTINAQLLIDDFTTGEISNLIFTDMSESRKLQTGDHIIGQNRQVFAKLNQNPFGHNMQLSVEKGILVMSYGYDTRGTTYINYGVNKDGNAPLNIDASNYKSLKVEFEAKSTVNGINLNLFTNHGYAAYGKHVPAREGKFVFTIPFTEIKPKGEGFTFSDIDYIRLQFDSRSKTGCNLAISKIWFE